MATSVVGIVLPAVEDEFEGGASLRVVVAVVGGMGLVSGIGRYQVDFGFSRFDAKAGIYTSCACSEHIQDASERRPAHVLYMDLQFSDYYKGQPGEASGLVLFSVTVLVPHLHGMHTRSV
jgi:hypothetical protein